MLFPSSKTYVKKYTAFEAWKKQFRNQIRENTFWLFCVPKAPFHVNIGLITMRKSAAYSLRIAYSTNGDMNSQKRQFLLNFSEWQINSILQISIFFHDLYIKPFGVTRLMLRFIEYGAIQLILWINFNNICMGVNEISLEFMSKIQI